MLNAIIRDWYLVNFDRPNRERVTVSWRNPYWPRKVVDVQEHQRGGMQGKRDYCVYFSDLKETR